VIVAVLDTGLSTGNAEFAGRLVPGYNAITDQTVSASGWGVVADGNGHGTHVTGTAAAATDNGYGIAGIAPGARIMPVKVMPDSGPGNFADLVDGLGWAVAHGADVVNISLSASSLGSMTATWEASFTAARDAGVIIVASSGNDGVTQTNYPCGFAAVICIASTTKSGSAVSTFSTRSSQVDVAAPGEAIVSTIPGGGFASSNGTSMAAPHVAGTAALIRSVASLDPEEVRAILTSTAVDLAPSGFDTASGHGRVDASAAVAAAVSLGTRPRVGVHPLGNPSALGPAGAGRPVVAASPPWDAPGAAPLEIAAPARPVAELADASASRSVVLRVRVEAALPAPRRSPDEPATATAAATDHPNPAASHRLQRDALALSRAAIPIAHLLLGR
jgi:subtilisin family serine protease